MHLVTQPLDRRHQTELLQHRGIELGGQTAHFAHDTFKYARYVVECGREWLRDYAAQRIDLDDRRVEFLPEAVMQIAGDALPLTHLGQRQLARQPGQLFRALAHGLLQ